MDLADQSLAADAEVIWHILVDRARARREITYKDLRDLVGGRNFHAGGWASRRLEHIQAYCWERGLPRLTVLVVNKSDGLPGEGYRGSVQDFFDDKERVFGHVWGDPPSVETLADCYVRKDEIYARPFEYAVGSATAPMAEARAHADQSVEEDEQRIGDLLYELGADAAAYDPFGQEHERVLRELSVLVRRGQPRFRRDLIAAYEGRCALSGCDVVEALEAAHIVPYSERGTDDITNGLLLRADLHTLLDDRKDMLKLRVTQRGAIEVVMSDALESHYGVLEFRPPLNPAHAPSPRAIERRWGSVS